jgi:hypothetical protein
MSDALNGDLSVRVAMDPQKMEWMPSPSGTVWRKRFHRVGPAESGQVTSLVRYEPASRFPGHGHPDGEEILVLEGVFSDEHGDWPAGTYLLNPEGFSHVPFSKAGCLLFVKLRQFPGKDRQHVVIDTQAVTEQPGGTPGISVRPLYEQPGYSDRVRLERWAPATRAEVNFAQGAELFIVEGALQDDAFGSLGPRSWLRLPPDTRWVASSPGGCVLYVKEGGFPYLR